MAGSQDVGGSGKADYGSSLKWAPQHGGARAIDDGDLLPSEPMQLWAKDMEPGQSKTGVLATNVLLLPLEGNVPARYQRCDQIVLLDLLQHKTLATAPDAPRPCQIGCRLSARAGCGNLCN